MTKPNGRPKGPPTKYKPAYCDEVIEFLAKGHSVAAFAGHISVNRDTVYEWAEQHPEFKAAKDIGINAATKWWEDRLIDSALNGKAGGNVTAIIFGLKNRAHKDWSDRIVSEHVGKGGGPIHT
jgi:transposase-like protein